MPREAFFLRRQTPLGVKICLHKTGGKWLNSGILTLEVGELKCNQIKTRSIKGRFNHGRCKMVSCQMFGSLGACLRRWFGMKCGYFEFEFGLVSLPCTSAWNHCCTLLPWTACTWHWTAGPLVVILQTGCWNLPFLFQGAPFGYFS